MRCGTRARLCSSSRQRSRESVPRRRPRCSASSARATIWEVKALVEATPISGPAWVSRVPAASRVSIEPCTLQMRDGQRAQPLGLAEGGQGVRRLAALGDGDASVSRVRPAACGSGTRCRSRPRPGTCATCSSRYLPDERRVPARAAGQQHHALGAASQLVRRRAQLLEVDLAFLEPDPAQRACRARRAAARGSPSA